MVTYLKGQITGIHKTHANRALIDLEVNGVGYGLVVTSRLLKELPESGETVQLFTHLQMREDQLLLYGFLSRAERDLFQRLISVNGVGAQLALALLDALGLQELVQAIISGNTRTLSRTPGVGTKTAERIALELKTKLAQWRQDTGLITRPPATPTPDIQEDVELTLGALGYTDTEIQQALMALGEHTTLSKSKNPEDWLREAIAWLSQPP
ncbi:Holliday junction branch migration protein RuvA [Candidatus Synechococcus calcipolaris G9]|uniref:Holliday junction branch migration complex subunit RuvA n=1 Tax=Candidatus Synechococcus calcipolaris G9 TaxID=1497997 RepID=A0ABT6F2S0_9SYNE|nr:Holliday junction branch migration protein RuvA [Candidatus Synechococcus calcipolaris]MDG2992163.1 Holliday junction branch migration protein RuvA [Candidatus Synechococcus calcipolaris G9]